MTRRLLELSAVVAFMCACLWATAAAPARAGEKEPATVVVTRVQGVVTVGTSGQVDELELHTSLPEAVRTAVEKRLRQLKFEPVLVDGQPTTARAGFTVGLWMHDLSGGGVRVGFDGLRFHLPMDVTETEAQRASRIHPQGLLTPGRYPAELNRYGVGGEVTLAVLVAPDGSVEDVVAVRGHVFGPMRANLARQAVAQFAASARSAALKWRMNVPPALAGADARRRTFYTLMSFHTGVGGPARYGEWQRVTRVPATTAPWMPREEAPPPAPSGGIAAADGPLRLAEPLDASPVM